MRMTVTVYGQGNGRQAILRVAGYPPVTIRALAQTIGKPIDTIRKRLRNWDDPALICSRGGGGGSPLPAHDDWPADIRAAARISKIPQDCTPAQAPTGWGYGQCRAAVTIRKRTPGAKLSRWREGRNE